ncbi:hypothetical protein V6B14_08525 [Sporosarcina psychrophila]|uniref:hypothetical protein n=1 Tax=Sporosarcina psychrophila TaxID=1476 RepID=UPI0030CFCEE6
MKNRYKNTLIGLMLSMALVLGACGNTDESFRNIKWGMTMEEVIAIEEKEGNSDFELYEDFVDMDLIEYENVVVNGHKASLEYSFANEVDGYDLIHKENYLPEKMFDEYEALKSSDFDEEEVGKELKKIDEKYKKDIEEYMEFLDQSETVKFSDYILIGSSYSFEDLDEEDIKEIRNSLIAKYGEPSSGEEDDDDYLFRYLDTIELYYSEDIGDGEVTIGYSANYKALEYKMKKNKSNSSGL